MSEPFLGEIKMIGFNFAPRGWAYCDGQVMPINQNQSLYSLLGTTYGGDGRTSFALPDLRSRTPIHRGDGFSLGQKGGMETVTLTTGEMAVHTHTVHGTSADADSATVGPNANMGYARVVETETGDLIYGDISAASTVAMANGVVSTTEGGQAHPNMQPYTTLGFCIALQGLFPSRN